MGFYPKFKRKRGVYMTLRKMADLSKDLFIETPDLFDDEEIRFSEDFCRYALLKYVQSQKFKEDMETCLLDYEESLDKPFNESWLELSRDSEGIFTIKMRFGGWTIT